MGPLGSDIDAVKKQIIQLKDFKDEVDPQMVKVEALNRSVWLILQAFQSRQHSINTRWSNTPDSNSPY